MQALKRNFFLRGFFRDRGYESESQLTEHAISALPNSPPLKCFAHGANRLFNGPDKAKLKNEKDLRHAGEFLESNAFGLAVVVASGGTTGDSEETKMLTQARAVIVRDYLVNHFSFDDTRLKTRSELARSGTKLMRAKWS
jgi:hypothetical protein